MVGIGTGTRSKQKGLQFEVKLDVCFAMAIETTANKKEQPKLCDENQQIYTRVWGMQKRK